VVKLAVPYDAIVIGGGLIGASSAYELSKTGLRVLLLEKRTMGSGASGTSAAMLECQTDAHRGEPFLSLARASNRLFPALYQELLDLTGIDFQYEPSGILEIALTEEEARTLKAGTPAQWLDSNDVRKNYPQLVPENFGGAFYQNDGQVNGEKFLAAMAQAARLTGTEIKENIGPLHLVVNHDQALEARSRNEVFTADKFIVCAGAWSNEILKPIGHALELEPIRGQLIVFDTPKRPLPCPVYTRSCGYITPKKDGTTLAGSTIERVGFNEAATPEAEALLRSQAIRLLPSLSRQAVRGMTAGLRPGTPDDLPYLGHFPEIKNLIVATGHYRNGILLSPITAGIVASLVAGTPPPVDIRPFSPSRNLIAIA